MPGPPITGTGGPRAARHILTALALALTLTAAEAIPAWAGWLIEPKRFHASAHGQFSCQDCHEDAAAEAVHPDPQRATRSVEDFFEPERCFVCHDEIEADLSQGRHGQRLIKDRAAYRFCVRCHNPHYQLRRGENRLGRFEPGRPRAEQCGACHEPRPDLPPWSEEDRACLECHLQPSPEDPQRATKTAALCFKCHGLKKEEAAVEGRPPQLDAASMAASPHGGLDCLICHPQAAAYGHAEQRLGECTQCHPPHDEKKAGEAHLIVACPACHLAGVEPVKDPTTRRVVWQKKPWSQVSSRVHDLVSAAEESACRRCHHPQNAVGAAAVVLPAKSVICLPCHVGTFSWGDATTVVSLSLFVLGLVLVVSVWLSGAKGPPPASGLGVESGRGPTAALRIILAVRAVILDGFFQRRLFRRSKIRWALHALIFWPFVFRFSWGLAALLGSLWSPQQDWVWAMVDKNHPLSAFLFDLSGVLILLGIGLMVLRRLFQLFFGRVADLPQADWPALGLLSAIVVVGFVLEGMRMAMTNWPGGAEHALLGHGLALTWKGLSSLSEIYGWVWHVHAVLVGLFVAYLPFGRMFHVIMAPIILAVGAARQGGRGPQDKDSAAEGPGADHG